MYSQPTPLTMKMVADKPAPPDTSKFYTVSDLQKGFPTNEAGCFTPLTSWFCNLFTPTVPAIEPDYTIGPRQPAPASPSPFPEWTPQELETLITRWTCTYPGPHTHPQNVGISSLISLVDSNSATITDAANLHSSLIHRLRMDHHIELLARDLGLLWEELDVPAIEDFEPPPTCPMTTEARRLLLQCKGEWKERVMPLPDVGVRMRYRKPKYWIVSLMAKAGWSPEVVDVCMTAWFEERGGELFE